MVSSTMVLCTRVWYFKNIHAKRTGSNVWGTISPRIFLSNRKVFHGIGKSWISTLVRFVRQKIYVLVDFIRPKLSGFLATNRH